jgi:hypothetical protein
VGCPKASWSTVCQLPPPCLTGFFIFGHKVALKLRELHVTWDTPQMPGLFPWLPCPLTGNGIVGNVPVCLEQSFLVPTRVDPHPWLCVGSSLSREVARHLCLKRWWMGGLEFPIPPLTPLLHIILNCLLVMKLHSWPFL